MKGQKTNKELVILKQIEEQQLAERPLKKQTKLQVNSDTIVSPKQLILILCLILCSLVNIKLSEITSHGHIKNLRDNFNKHILGNDWLGLYDVGNNINQNKLQIVDFQQMEDHFSNMIDYIRNFTDFDGFPQFQLDQKNNIQLMLQFRNETLYQQIMDLDQLQRYLRDKIDLRQFLINLKQMKIRINLGKNDRVKNFAVFLHYTTHARSMLQATLELLYQDNNDHLIIKRAINLRILQQVFAFLLLITYLVKLNKLLFYHKKNTLQSQYQEKKTRKNSIKGINISQDNASNQSQQGQIKINSKIRKSQIYWCFSLIFLNLVTIVSWKLAPLSSLLQLLPIFQHHQSPEQNPNDYNFNQNLRYALPYVMSVFIPVFIFLNGFIMYSLIMWPGDYFDDYLKGFFSYFYNNFQVGTYQIFIQLQNRGQFAYMLYLLLYFYMILVGNNLYPALFCTLIQMAMTEKQMEFFIRCKIKKAMCPKCSLKTALKQEELVIDINVCSPKLSPYMRPVVKSYGNKTLQNNKQQNASKSLKVQIIQSISYQNNQQFIKFKVEKYCVMAKKLKQISLRQEKYNKRWKIEQISKIQKNLQKLTFLFAHYQ